MISAWIKIDKKRPYGADYKERLEIKERRKKYKRQMAKKADPFVHEEECSTSRRGFMQMSLQTKREKTINLNPKNKTKTRDK